MNELVKYFEKLYCQDKKIFYDLIKANLKNKKKMFIVTSNPETFTYGVKDKLFDKLLMDNNVTLIPDGISIVKSAKMLGFSITERITGIDLVTEILKICNELEYKLSLCGAKSDILDKLKEVIKSDYPKIKIGTCIDGYQENYDLFFQKISKEKPDVVLVALGIPAQEKLIYEHLKEFNKGIFIGVGGSFDVLSGSKKRAPKIWQKLNLEWLYRIIKEPKRIKRFYQNNVKFMIEVKKLKRRR